MSDIVNVCTSRYVGLSYENTNAHDHKYTMPTKPVAPKTVAPILRPNDIHLVSYIGSVLLSVCVILDEQLA
jgi:hypothetical protein